MSSLDTCVIALASSFTSLVIAVAAVIKTKRIEKMI